MRIITINQDILKKAIEKRVKPGKGSGHDTVYAKGLRLFGDEVSEGLTKVMVRITEKCQYPAQWKICRVKAAPKQGNTLERENYRPLSLLSMPSKVSEGIIGDIIDEQFAKRSCLVIINEVLSKERLLIH